jgi:D-amino-acid dehydrogenase
VTPVALPGVIRNVPGWLMDPLGPLALRWSYLPAILPYLRAWCARRPTKVRAQARALRPLIAPTVPLCASWRATPAPRADPSARPSLRLPLAERWRKTIRLGVAARERGRDRRVRRRRIAPARTGLSREYVRGLLVRENGPTSNPHRLVTRLVEQFRREGGEIVRASARGFRLDGKRLTAIRTDQAICRPTRRRLRRRLVKAVGRRAR